MYKLFQTLGHLTGTPASFTPQRTLVAFWWQRINPPGRKAGMNYIFSSGDATNKVGIRQRLFLSVRWRGIFGIVWKESLGCECDWSSVMFLCSLFLLSLSQCKLGNFVTVEWWLIFEHFGCFVPGSLMLFVNCARKNENPHKSFDTRYSSLLIVTVFTGENQLLLL